MPVEQAQIMLRLSLKGINIGPNTHSLKHGLKAHTHTCTPTASIVSVSLSSLNCTVAGLRRCASLFWFTYVKCSKCSLMFSPLQKIKRGKKKDYGSGGGCRFAEWNAPAKMWFSAPLLAEEARRMTKDGMWQERYSRGKIQVFDTPETESQQKKKHAG